MFLKREERELARRLRRVDGLPIRVIAERVGVSLGSVSVWVRDIELTAQQRAALDAANPARNGQRLGAANNSKRCRAERADAQQHGRALARKGDPLHIQGCMLHWAEGSKRRNSVTFTNSDDAVMDVFVRFLRQCYGVTDDRMTLSVNCFLGNGLTINEIQDWWLQRLCMPASCIRTPAINRVSTASKRLKARVLPYGTARLTVHSTFIVQSIYGAIQEYAGIDRPEWLDL
jgi:hypothetical protein